MPTNDPNGLTSSPRQRRAPISPVMSVPQIAELLGWSRYKARRWVLKHGIARQVAPNCDIEVPLSALRSAFSEAWDSILEAQSFHGEHDHR